MNLPKLYSQQDSRWSQKLLGFNTDPQYNIYDYGCLITSLAMVASYYGKDTNPEHINESLKKVKGFSNGGFYNWGSVKKVYKDLKEHWVGTPDPLTNDQINRIKDALDNGFPVMVQIDYNPRTVKLDMHYVLIIGYDPSDENNFTIADPLGGEIVSMKKYLGWWRPNVRRTIEQFIIYEAKVLTDTASLEKKIMEIETAFKDFRKAHEKELSEIRKECQNKLLEVKKSLQKVVNKL